MTRSNQTAAAGGLPWRISNSEDDAFTMNGAKPVAILTADGSVVACNTTYYPKAIDADDAALIVRAVNSHAALVGQLESAQVDLDLLRRAIEEGDPKAELLMRVTDLWKRNAAALQQAGAE